jgi:hypothetical protein
VHGIIIFFAFDFLGLLLHWDTQSPVAFLSWYGWFYFPSRSSATWITVVMRDIAIIIKHVCVSVAHCFLNEKQGNIIFICHKVLAITLPTDNSDVLTFETKQHSISRFELFPAHEMKIIMQK